jgi:prepilin-type N-terminal cleavage/methylation domain-containing protein
MRTESRDPQAGFSMVELTVAMLITLIVSGAIYALIVSGGNSFRREPALTDRQQNARVALDMVSRDVLSAGQGTPPKLAWIQLFRRGLNAAGPNVSYAMPNGERSDILQLIGNDGSCPDMTVCAMKGASMTTQSRLPSCFGMPGLVLAWDDKGHDAVLFGCVPGKGTNNASHCDGGNENNPDNSPNGHVVYPKGQSDFNPPGGKITDPMPCVDAGGSPANNCPEWEPTGISPVVVVRYEIRVDSDNVPNLWRSPFAGQDVSAALEKGQCKSDDPGLGDGWEMIARGIEDFQIRYMSQSDYEADPAGDTWLDEPPITVDNDYGTIVRQVELTLHARTVGENRLQGEGTKNGVTAVRGQVRTVVTPRAALLALSLASPEPKYK